MQITTEQTAVKPHLPSNYLITNQRKNHGLTIRVNLARMRPNSNKYEDKEEKMGDLIRECGETINYFARFPVDVVQASKLRLLPSLEGRIAGRWTRITNDAVARQKGPGVLSSVFSFRSLQILSGISRKTDNIYQTMRKPWKALSSNSISGCLTFHEHQ